MDRQDLQDIYFFILIIPNIHVRKLLNLKTIHMGRQDLQDIYFFILVILNIYVRKLLNLKTIHMIRQDLQDIYFFYPDHPEYPCKKAFKLKDYSHG